MALNCSLTLDLDNTAHLAALKALVEALGMVTDSQEVATVKTQSRPKLAETPSAEEPSSKKQIEAKKELKEKAVLSQPQVEEKSSEITVETVRATMAPKLALHRAAIKEALTKFEAPNVSSLKKESYGEFIKFLENLS